MRAVRQQIHYHIFTPKKKHKTYLDVVEPVLRAVRLIGEHGEEVAHGLHLPHRLGVEQARLDALWVG